MSNEFTDDDFAAMQQLMQEEKDKIQFKSLYWKPQNEGTYQIRLLTPLKQFNEQLFYEYHRIHYINKRSYLCLNQELKDKNGNIHSPEFCPICAKSKQLYNISKKGDEEYKIAGDLRAKDRYVSRIIVRGKKTAEGKDEEYKPEFWEFGKKIYTYFFDQIRLKEAGNFLSLKSGRDYNLIKKGSGQNTDYSGSCLSMKQSPVFSDTEKLKKLLEELPKMNYNQLVEFQTQDELKQVLNEYLNGPSEPEENSSIPETAVEEDTGSSSVNTTVTNSPADEPQDDIDALLGMI